MMPRQIIWTIAALASGAAGFLFLIGLIADVTVNGRMMLPARSTPEPADLPTIMLLLVWSVSSIITALVGRPPAP